MPNENILILKKLFKRRKQLLIVTVVTAVVSYISCFLITPVYKSTAFVYPTNLVAYSEESSTEQLLQYMNSNDIRLYLQKKLNLCAHYKIDTTQKKWPFFYDGVYEKKISISQTKYESIEIRVEDSDPDTAQLIVSTIIEATNKLIEREHRKNYMETVNNAKIYVDYKKHEADSTQKLMNELNEKYKLLNLGIQLKDLVGKQVMMSGGKNGSFDDLVSVSQRLKNLEEDGKGIPTASLISQINNYSIQYGKLAIYLDDQARAWAWANNDYQKKLSESQYKTTFMASASKPTLPAVASWPRKSIVVLISCLAVLLISSFYFIFIDKIKLAYEQIASEE